MGTDHTMFELEFGSGSVRLPSLLHGPSNRRQRRPHAARHVNLARLILWPSVARTKLAGVRVAGQLTPSERLDAAPARDYLVFIGAVSFARR